MWKIEGGADPREKQHDSIVILLSLVQSQVAEGISKLINLLFSMFLKVICILFQLCAIKACGYFYDHLSKEDILTVFAVINAVACIL